MRLVPPKQQANECPCAPSLFPALTGWCTSLGSTPGSTAASVPAMAQTCKGCPIRQQALTTAQQTCPCPKHVCPSPVSPDPRCSPSTLSPATLVFRPSSASPCLKPSCSSIRSSWAGGRRRAARQGQGWLCTRTGCLACNCLHTPYTRGPSMCPPPSRDPLTCVSAAGPCRLWNWVGPGSLPAVRPATADMAKGRVRSDWMLHSRVEHNRYGKKDLQSRKAT